MCLCNPGARSPLVSFGTRAQDTGVEAESGPCLPGVQDKMGEKNGSLTQHQSPDQQWEAASLHFSLERPGRHHTRQLGPPSSDDPLIALGATLYKVTERIPGGTADPM